MWWSNRALAFHLLFCKFQRACVQFHMLQGCVTLWWLLGTDEQYPKPKERPRQQVSKRGALPGHTQNQQKNLKVLALAASVVWEYSMSWIPDEFPAFLSPTIYCTHFSRCYVRAHHSHLNNIGDKVWQGFVHFDLLTVLFDLVFHGLELVGHSQYLTLHDLQSVHRRKKKE